MKNVQLAVAVCAVMANVSFGLTLVDQDRSTCAIVVAKDATESERGAANEMLDLHRGVPNDHGLFRDDLHGRRPEGARVSLGAAVGARSRGKAGGERERDRDDPSSRDDPGAGRLPPRRLHGSPPHAHSIPRLRPRAAPTRAATRPQPPSAASRARSSSRLAAVRRAATGPRSSGPTASTTRAPARAAAATEASR